MICSIFRARCAAAVGPMLVPGAVFAQTSCRLSKRPQMLAQTPASARCGCPSKRGSGDFGFASIDRNYGLYSGSSFAQEVGSGLNGDRYNTGIRISSHLTTRSIRSLPRSVSTTASPG